MLAPPAPDRYVPAHLAMRPDAVRAILGAAGLALMGVVIAWLLYKTARVWFGPDTAGAVSAEPQAHNALECAPPHPTKIYRHPVIDTSASGVHGSDVPMGDGSGAGQVDGPRPVQ